MMLSRVARVAAFNSNLFLPSVSAAATSRSSIAFVPRRTFTLAAVGSDADVTKEESGGALGTLDYRLKLISKATSKPVSPWHSIDLKSSTAGRFNMLTEISKNGKRKMEVDTESEGNPIKQDVKKGNVREYHGPIFWNYGCFPQTWEDPNIEHPELKVNGDNDPLDCLEIGKDALEPGSITSVKPLGVLAMIDDGELDWKVICIRESEESDYPNGLDSVPAAVKDGIREWFRWYKTPDGKPLNEFGFDEKWLGEKEVLEVIEETNAAWKNLKDGGVENNGGLWIGD